MPRRATPKAVHATLALATLATAAFAHEEDWRKLQDLQQPYEGPIYSAANNARSATNFPAQGMTLLSHVPTSNIGTGGNAADIWGYTSPSGREYALITVSAGLGLVEITDPFNPVVRDFIPSSSSLWHDVKTIGQYAYKVNESGEGIQVIDLSDADNGNMTLVQNKFQQGHATTHNIVAHEETGYLYLTGANVANGGLVAVDTNADPANPTFAGSWTTRYVHDAQVVTWQHGDLAGRELAFCFNGGAGFDIVDVTDKSNMTRIGGATYAGVRYCHQGWLSEDQQWLYINDELDEGATVNVTTTRVFRVHDPDFAGPPANAPSPTNPVFVGTFTSGVPAIDHNLYTRDGIIYQANYRSGLRVFDATQTPDQPQQIAFFDGFVADDAPSFNGAWSVYPYFDSQVIIVSDIEQGLFVLRLDAGPTAQFLDIDITTTLPDIAPPGQPLTINADTRANNTNVDANGYILRITTNNQSPQDIPMTPVGSPAPDGTQTVTADIPPSACFDDITVQVVAKDTQGRSFQSAPQSFTIADDKIVIATSDNPTIDWTTNATATAGQWEFGAPAGNGDRADPATDADGNNTAWLTQNAAGNTDVDNGSVSLTTEPYNLAEGGTVSFALWFNDTPNGPASPEDTFLVEVSTDGGAFTPALEIANTSATWRNQEISFGPAGDFPASSNVQLRFTTADFGNQNIIEGGLDALLVSRTTCEPPADCPADVTGDGVVTALDISTVLSNFGSTSTDADTNGDGLITALDISNVLSAFGSICP